ncbi:MAG: helix-turn-helix domain-containing protein [Acidobacteria bacterium]|nr:helix-turn-helix domain-containing protein [Acidobacteriota bacterium]
MSVSNSVALHVKLAQEPSSWTHGVLDEHSHDYCRRDMVRTMVNVLRDSSGFGVLLVGEHGTGKTYLARKAIDQLKNEYLIVQAQGSSVASALPYGALRPLLNGVQIVGGDHPVSVAQALSQHLRQLANGQDILLCVDNAGDLDELSALVISQLAGRGVVRLLVVCNDLLAAPSEVVSLWRHGSLERMDIGSFSRDETAEWVSSHNGTAASAAVATALWEVSGGSPRQLDVIWAEQMESKALILQDGVWVLSGKLFEYRDTAVNALLLGIGTHTATEQRVVELLALTNGLSLGELLAVADSSAVDALQMRGTVRITSGSNPRVTLATQLGAHMVRRHVPSCRSRELHKALSTAHQKTTLQPSTLLAMAIWALDCGAELSQEQTVRAVRLAVDARRPVDALRLLDYLDAANRRAMVREEATSYYLSGDADRAGHILASMERCAQEWPLETWCLAMILWAQMLSEDSTARGREVLLRVRAELDQALSGEASTAVQTGALRDQLALAEAELAVFDGRYREACDVLDRLRADTCSASNREIAATRLAGIWTIVGRLTDAQKLSRASTVRVDVPAAFGPTGELFDAVITRFIESVTQQDLAASCAVGCSQTFDAARADAANQLFDGVLSAYAGRAEDALNQLVPALAQMRAWGNTSAARVAAAAAAYCHALLGDNDGALSFLNPVTAAPTASGFGGMQRNSTVGSRAVASVCSYFQVMASAELASAEKANVRLFALADEEKRRRAPFLEMVFLCAAVRGGSTDGAQRLVNVAGSVQGRYAEICALYGTAIVKRDGQLLVGVAEMAEEAGNDLFARDVARAALKLGTEAADRSITRPSARIIRSCIQHLGSLKASNDDGQTLTSRELEVARLAAAGVSNRAIAAKMHISVRTVEGHLYQVYGKLQVTNRSELKSTFA